MSSLNQTQLIGNLGTDPQILKETEKGPFVRLSLATTEEYQGAHGKLQKTPEWHTVYASNNIGKVAVEYLQKGDKIYISGKLRKTEWKDKQGQQRFSTAIYAKQLIFLNLKKKPPEEFSGISEEEAAAITEADLTEMDRKAA